MLNRGYFCNLSPRLFQLWPDRPEHTGRLPVFPNFNTYMMVSRYLPYLLAGLCCLLAGAVHGQAISFLKSMGATEGNRIADILQLPDGYLAAGSTFGFGDSYNRATLIRTDKHGNVLWQKKYG